MKKRIFSLGFAMLLLLSGCAVDDAPEVTSPTLPGATAPADSTGGSTVPQTTEGGATTSPATTNGQNTTAPDPTQPPATTTEAPPPATQSTAPPQTTAPATEAGSTAPQNGDEFLCTIKIRCDTALKYDGIDEDLLSLLPADGNILTVEGAVFYQDETAFNVLQRETRKHKIHMEFSKTPAYNSAYIEGISNLYEMSCGQLSGWVFKVNGQWPGFGSSNYKLQQGDIIEWLYTCDLGADVGAEGASLGGGEQ